MEDRKSFINRGTKQLMMARLLTSSFPGKIGFPWRSSAKIQPTDHISTAGPYFVVPSSNSGGLRKMKITGSHSNYLLSFSPC
jgi:hypothetical protein